MLMLYHIGNVFGVLIGLGLCIISGIGIYQTLMSKEEVS